jgi:HK97 family phage major capsid protein
MSETMIKRLLEQRANVWEQAKELLDRAATENRDLSAEEEKAYERANADLDAIDVRRKDLEEQARAAKDAEQFLSQFSPKDPTPGKRSTADELRAAFKGENRDGYVTTLDPAEVRDLTVGSATAGGDTRPTSFSGRLWAHLIEVANVINAGATVITTDGGEDFGLPTTTAHSTAALTAEGAAISESDPAFVKRTLGAYKYAVLLQVSSELVTDTGVDLEGYIAMQAGRAVGNSFGTHLVTGTGSSQPYGIATGSTLGVTGGAGVSGAFTADNLIDLHYSVIGPYRNSPSCAWLMRDATMGAVRKLKGSDNNYLWQPGLVVGAPDTLLGKGVYTDPNVAAVALSAKSVFFGDMSAYHVRVVNDVRFDMSAEYAFNADLITYRCTLRGDGTLLDRTGAIKHFIGNAA